MTSQVGMQNVLEGQSHGSSGQDSCSVNEGEERIKESRRRRPSIKSGKLKENIVNLKSVYFTAPGLITVGIKAPAKPAKE